MTRTPRNQKKQRKTKKIIFLRSPGGDSDLAPESEMFVFFFGFLRFFGSLAVWGGDNDLAPESEMFGFVVLFVFFVFFGSLAVWGGDSDLAPESEMFGFFSFFCFFGSLVVWVCTEKHVFA